MSKHAITICIELGSPGGLDFLATEDVRRNPYGHPYALRVAQRLPETDLWIPDLGSDQIDWLNLDESDQAFANKDQAVHWIRTGEMPCQKEERERLLEILDFGNEP